MSTLTELKSLKALVNRLLRKVNCACSLLPASPPDGTGLYYLQYNSDTQTYTWEPN